MCGIVGIANGPGAEIGTISDVRKMADSIVHRGPDDEGFHDAGEVVIAMRRLSIIDVSGGHQPIANEDKTVWVVLNGEIFNFRELRDRLVARGHRFETSSDTEVIVHLYEEYGDDFLRHLSGMFALAVWDSRKRMLTIARDRLGVKPLYFRRHGSSLAFASELKALLPLRGVKVDFDREALTEYLALGYAVAPRTIMKGTEKLPPATKLTWQAGRVTISRYWEVPNRCDDDVSVEEWIDRTRAELERSVAAQMVSDVPIGAFLSGGVDSSTVVALMSRHSDQPVNTYAIGYQGEGAAAYYNELPYAASVAQSYRTHHNEILVSPDITRLLPTLVWHLEEPICDSAAVTTYLVAQLAAKSVKVILAGVGGDELFAGYNRYRGDDLQRTYRRLPRWLRHNVLPKLAELLPSGRENRLMDIGRYAKQFIRGDSLPWHEQYKLYVSLIGQESLSKLLRYESSAPNGFDRAAGDEKATDPLLRLFRLDHQTALAEDLLLMTDKMTMANSIECRVPLLDDGLVEMAARIPSAVKLRDGQLKYVLKQAVREWVPAEVLSRRKRGFGAPMGSWLKNELRPLREAILGRRSIERRGLLAPDAVARILADHDANREDYTDLLMTLINLEVWARLFVDAQSPEQVAGDLAEQTRAA